MAELERITETFWHKVPREGREPYSLLKIFYIVKGARGAISLLMMWSSNIDITEFSEGDRHIRLTDNHFTAGPVCWHGYKPTEYSKEPQKCDWLDGAECYGECGYILGEKIGQNCIEGDTDEMWRHLEELYVEEYGGQLSVDKAHDDETIITPKEQEEV